jgi:hypothetical protein
MCGNGPRDLLMAWMLAETGRTVVFVVHVYIYIYIERERERERSGHNGNVTYGKQREI